MRFLWIALSIICPLIVIEFDSYEAGVKRTVYYAVGTFAEIIFLGFCVSEFIKSRKEQEYLTHQRIRSDRDEDIKKWRKEFMRDSLDLYEVQKESLKRAENLKGQVETVDPPKEKVGDG